MWIFKHLLNATTNPQFLVLELCVSTYVCVIMFLLFSLDATYTVEEAVEKLGFGSFQILVTVFSGLLWVSM